MTKKIATYKTKRMNRDTSVSSFNSEYCFENLNLRLCTNEGNTQMSWVNERGTKALKYSITSYNGGETYSTIEGVPIGTATINHKMVLFTTQNNGIIENPQDYIYVLELDGNTIRGKLLFTGNLNFSSLHPLETLPSYESESIQKIYWTDNYNSPRLINIAADDKDVALWNTCDESICTHFDFTPSIDYNVSYLLPGSTGTTVIGPEIEVQKLCGTSGNFAAGVIQYSFTYYNKYMQETCIFHTTPLYYISPKDRGAAADENVGVSFKITIRNFDKKYDYIRIYSIHRTSLNDTPIAKRVTDIYIKDLEKKRPVNTDKDYWDRYEIFYIDTGTNGDSITPTDLFYKGGESILAKTFEQKDNTFFLGNITVTRDSVKQLLMKNAGGFKGFYTKDTKVTKSDDGEETVTSYEYSNKHSKVVDGTRVIYLGEVNDLDTGNYIYHNQLTAFKDDDRTISTPCGGFKTGDIYRLGVQFQYKTGKWSEPMWLGDHIIENRPFAGYKAGEYVISEGKTVTLPTVQVTIESDIVSVLVDNGYVRARPLIVIPDRNNRRILCQGAACPTLYTEKKRNEDKGLYAQSSWFFRTCHYYGEGEEDNYPAAVNSVGAVIPASDFIPSLKNHKITYAEVNTQPISSNSGTLVIDVNSTKYTTKDYYNPNHNKEKEGIAAGDSTHTYPNIKQIEIGCVLNTDHEYKVDTDFYTVHTPELQFDEFRAGLDLSNTKVTTVGWNYIDRTFSDIDIQTNTPTVSSDGEGFVHKSFITKSNEKEDYISGNYGIVSGLFYDDYCVDDSNDKEFEKYSTEKTPVKWMVYLWHKTGSLNNDCNRPSDKGNPTAELSKKIVSNLRYCKLVSWNTVDYSKISSWKGVSPAIFSSEEPTIVKVNDNIYMGNIDSMVVPDEASGMYFAVGTGEEITTDMEDTAKINAGSTIKIDVETPFTAKIRWKTWAKNEDDATKHGLYFMSKDSDGLYNWDTRLQDGIGDKYVDLVLQRSSVRIKYKSAPHIVVGDIGLNFEDMQNYCIPVVELAREIETDPVSSDYTIFGGVSEDAFKENNWIPCGDPMMLYHRKRNTISDIEVSDIVLNFEYGDTYFQRWDCLKTYPFTKEDPNQVVEIGSFMLEARMNMDGRYDKNRGQVSNINMSPVNFNLYNPIYSQMDNFFTYKILDDDSYKDTYFPNQLTYTMTKTSGNDVDLWTNLTLASMLELDGDKGALNKLTKMNDQLLAFQDTGFSQILYNENVQMSTENGVPVEIANSGKVTGKRYISDSIGCSNKWSLVNAPTGIYFIDNYDRGIYHFDGNSLKSLSIEQGMDSWAKQNIGDPTTEWTPIGFSNYVTYYDKVNQDILFINDGIALAYSERAGTFTSFYNYGHIPYLVNFENTGLWVKATNNNTTPTSIWEHGKGDYCSFFGTTMPYWTILIGNPEPTLSKVFTNLDFRACVDNEGNYDTSKDTVDAYKPFDSLEVWDEYQHGYGGLSTSTNIHDYDNTSSLKRKFRIWRCDIPRDNALIDKDRKSGTSYPYSRDSKLGIARFKMKPLDRMRNPWLYIKLQKSNVDNEVMYRSEIHDVTLTYFN